MSRPDWCSRVENVRGSFGAPRPLPKRAAYVPKATERRPARAIVDSNKPKSMNAPIRKITQQRVATGVDVRAARISNAATRAQKRGPHKAVSKPPEDTARAQAARPNASGGARRAAVDVRRRRAGRGPRARCRSAARRALRRRVDGPRQDAAARTRRRRRSTPAATSCAGGADSWMDSLDPKDWRGHQAFGDAREAVAGALQGSKRARHSQLQRLLSRPRSRCTGRREACAAFGAPLSLDVDDAKAPAPAGDDRLVTAVDGRTVEGKATRTITWDQLKKNYDPRDEWVRPPTGDCPDASGDSDAWRAAWEDHDPWGPNLPMDAPAPAPPAFGASATEAAFGASATEAGAPPAFGALATAPPEALLLRTPPPPPRDVAEGAAPAPGFDGEAADAASSASKASLASKPSEVSIGLVDAPAEVVVDVAPGQYPTPVPTWESGGTRSRACSPTAQFAAGLRSDTPEPYEHEKTFFVEPVELERSCLDDDGRGVDDDDEPPPTPDFDYARGLQQPGTYGDESFECFDDEDQP
ncbi:hypothetical protein JL721_2769 [Aureococcus anophagefferens]|nr:hypothetical protein JL721_2769 [Aureococcus anophagefferens]